ncbi:hypothetical protein EJ03DRAFT_384487 [Teratosphaeria nubilosa]|uniref:Uncharacterized protein n=1 Tax=Teratosphaeria nubilosa TaxID=161662 RepID=A0A6G1L1L0_9PEZI|nr:hypothetical protein EJ03DRAFT_384487 [Teratosphaeria nubilosa]
MVSRGLLAVAAALLVGLYSLCIFGINEIYGRDNKSAILPTKHNLTAHESNLNNSSDPSALSKRSYYVKPEQRWPRYCFVD